ncbi:MAG: MATE family efflux transporter [Aureispira sp.]
MKSNELGTEKIGKLIIQQGVPAAIGFMVMSFYMIVDTIFVGRWVGPMGIAAITVVLPIVFLIASVGMAIGIGGASIISRALGADNEELAQRVFGNQVLLNTSLATLFVILGFLFEEPLLRLFGAQGAIMPPSKVYFRVLLIGIPFLSWAMMSNHIIRAQGFPKVAMNVLLLPALFNLVLDPIFIYVLEWGMQGAALATIFAYFLSASYTLWFFFKGGSDLKITRANLSLDWPIIREMTALGFVSFARQGTLSLLAIILNSALYNYGSEIYVSAYGIINRLMVFSLFPITGISQGFLPITSYNYGAKRYDRVREGIRKSLVYGTILAILIYIIILSARFPIIYIFTDNADILDITPHALVVVFMATPIALIQLIGSAYYQAIGKPLPALLLTLTKQGFCLIPLLFILPQYWGINGIWWAFPIADVLAALITGVYLLKAYRKLQQMEQATPDLSDHLIERKGV